MRVLPLGAGQDVGKSCIIVTIADKTIMLDCGMHMGYNDGRRFPDFSQISKTGNFSKLISCVIISHFHLDHSGALPYFTELLGYDGPIYTTHPTKAVLPILLEDYRKISAEKFQDKKNYSKKDIENCLKKIKTINLLETFEHEKDFIIRPYYAGHVIGAAMFYVKIKDKSFVYTGDFNTTADKHLGSAWIDRLEPTLLITESTYGSVIRECRKAKEREFINSIQECINQNGKVLIPIFALGRAQELCLLLDNYWERMGLTIPIYSTAGLTDKANSIYKLFIGYTNEAIKSTKNPFNFKNIRNWDNSKVYEEGPMVLFASPGMLHSGTSLSVFKKWCSDPKNLIIIPGYCVRNTVGEKLLSGATRIEHNSRFYDVNMKIKNLAFSAHADEKGILQIIEQCRPKNVMLVHGDKIRMIALKKSIEHEFKIPVFMPRNGVTVDVPVGNVITFKVKKEVCEQLDSHVVGELVFDDDGFVITEFKQLID